MAATGRAATDSITERGGGTLKVALSPVPMTRHPAACRKSCCTASCDRYSPHLTQVADDAARRTLGTCAPGPSAFARHCQTEHPPRAAAAMPLRDVTLIRAQRARECPCATAGTDDAGTRNRYMHGHAHGGMDVGHDTAVVGRRAWAILGALLVCVVTATAVGLVVLWPGPVPPSPLVASAVGAETDTVEARVVSVSSVSCFGTSEDRLPDGSIPATVVCTSAVMLIGSGPDRGRRVEVAVPTPAYRSGLEPGDRVQLVRFPASPQGLGAPAATDISPTPSTKTVPTGGPRPTTSALPTVNWS